MAFCSHCGAQVEKDQHFCANCGNPVEGKRLQEPVPSVQSRSAMSVWISVLLCIALLLSLIPVFSLLTVRSTLRQKTVLTMMQRLDLDEIPMWQLDPAFEDNKSLSLAEYICDMLNETISQTMDTQDWSPFTPRELKRCMEETSFPEFFAQQSVKLVEACRDGNATFSVRARDVEKVLKENERYLRRERGIYLDEESISDAARQFLKGSGLDELALPEQGASVLKTVNGMLSPWALLPSFLVILAMLVLLFVVNRKCLRCALRDTGLVCVLGTVLPLAVTVMVRQMIDHFEGSNALLYIGSVAASCVLETALLPYILVFFTGVVLLIACAVLKFRKRTVQAP